MNEKLKHNKINYRSETQIPKEILNNPKISDEIIFKDLVHKIVNDIPLDQLGKIFSLKKLDTYLLLTQTPASPQGVDVDRYRLELIDRLRAQDTVMYTAMISLP